MPRVGFETMIPVIPVFEQAKTIHALDQAATVTGGFKLEFRKQNQKN
jgi:hypothetical protein